MPKINITEIDLTTPGVASESTDIVYVPGFVDINQDSLYKNASEDSTIFVRGKYIGIEPGKPQLFTSVSQFNSMCGKSAPTFKTAQLYSMLGTDKFSASAINGMHSPAVMFEAGQADPGYVMAKELLAAGISVLFERVNKSNEPECEKVDITKSELTDTAKAVKLLVMDEKGAVNENKGNTYLFYYDESKTDYISYNTPTNLGALYEGSATDPTYKEFDIDNIYIQTSTSITIQSMYEDLNTTAYSTDVDRLVDRGNYSVKYITSGGYPVYEYDSGGIVTKMLNLAEKRGDCVALIDHVDNPKRTIDPAQGKGSVFDALNSATSGYANGDFGAMFTPWATYNRVTSDEIGGKSVSGKFRAPASFAYLTSLADSIKTNANWLAIAGAARGGVLNIADDGMDVVIPNGVADEMQPRSGKTAINAITNIKPYGMTIWGNRTLKKNEDNLVATSFLNVRNLISDIKKTCYRAARKTTFEQDTDILWINFKSEISKLLERMKSGYGISGYKIVRDNNHEMAAEKATLCAKIIIYPTYAVEDFYITVVLQDNEVSVN